jgi:glutamyl/glutaminyl-tRNA synthetase
MPDSAAAAAKTPRVRFAPSLTGYLHVVEARTSLFNWLFARRIMQHAQDVLATNSFEPHALEQALREAAAALGIKTGRMFQPIRVVVCGRKNAPPPFETTAVLGRELCLVRIRQAEASLQSLASAPTLS